MVNYNILCSIFGCFVSVLCCMFDAGESFKHCVQKTLHPMFPLDHFINKWEMYWSDTLTNSETFLRETELNLATRLVKDKIGSLNELFLRINEITSTELQILCRALTDRQCGPYMFISESCFSSYFVRPLTVSQLCRDVNHLKLLPWKWMTRSLVPAFKLSALIACINWSLRYKLVRIHYKFCRQDDTKCTQLSPAE
jgi:hypothetical protein